jgi:hypothetical protein
MGNKETLEAAKIYATGKSSIDVFKEEHIRDFMEGAKWQQEQDKNKYSENDLEVAFFEGRENKLSFVDWFEQFKNK